MERYTLPISIYQLMIQIQQLRQCNVGTKTNNQWNRIENTKRIPIKIWSHELSQSSYALGKESFQQMVLISLVFTFSF